MLKLTGVTLSRRRKKKHFPALFKKENAKPCLRNKTGSGSFLPFGWRNTIFLWGLISFEIDFELSMMILGLDAPVSSLFSLLSDGWAEDESTT